MKVSGHKAQRTYVLVWEGQQHDPLKLGGFVELDCLGDLTRTLIDGAEKRQTGDLLFEVVEQPSAEDVGRQHTEQKQDEQRHHESHSDQRLAHESLGDRPEPLVHEPEDESGEKDSHHQRKSDHKADQQPGTNPAADAPLVLAAPREIAQAPEEATFLDWVSICHDR